MRKRPVAVKRKRKRAFLPKANASRGWPSGRWGKYKRGIKR